MKVQKFYTVFFLIFTSLSFASTSIYSWEYYFVGGIFLIAMVINFALNFTFKKRKQEV
jgi:bacteriorhodopsin